MGECCEQYGLAAVKRDWVPEWLWALLCRAWLPFFGYLVLIQPFYWLLTRRPTDADLRKAAGLPPEGNGDEETHEFKNLHHAVAR